MDLISRRRGAECLRYNWSGWRALGDFLDRHNRTGYVPVLADSNDGSYLTAADCRGIADLIEANPVEYNAIYGGTPKADAGYGDNPAPEHAAIWRNSGGMRQC